MTKVSTITPCFHMEKYMEGFLRYLPEQTILNDIEVVLDHNEPTDNEVKLVNEYNKKHGNIKHIIVDEVDPIGTSMNRCIKESSGEYLCIWNVDDLRTPDSIEVMAKALDENPDVDFVYGNYIVVSKFETTMGYMVDETGKERYLKTGMILGPFFMFRKSACMKAGVFDEQLVSGADYDLALRLAMNGKGMHIPEVLGFYLNEGKGASTRPDSKQPLERTVIELRYDLDVLEGQYIDDANKYDVNNLVIDGKKIPVKEFV